MTKLNDMIQPEDFNDIENSLNALNIFSLLPSSIKKEILTNSNLPKEEFLDLLLDGTNIVAEEVYSSAKDIKDPELLTLEEISFATNFLSDESLAKLKDNQGGTLDALYERIADPNISLATRAEIIDCLHPELQFSAVLKLFANMIKPLSKREQSPEVLDLIPPADPPLTEEAFNINFD